MWQGNIKAAKLKQSEQVELLAFLANCLKNGFSLTKSLQLLPCFGPSGKSSWPGWMKKCGREKN